MAGVPEYRRHGAGAALTDENLFSTRRRRAWPSPEYARETVARRTWNRSRLRMHRPSNDGGGAPESSTATLLVRMERIFTAGRKSLSSRRVNTQIRPASDDWLSLRH